MKNLLLLLSVLISSFCTAGNIPAYFQSDIEFDNIESASSDFINKIQSKGYDIIGTYSPSNNKNQKVIIFTSEELKQFSNNFSERGALAVPLRIGIRMEDGKARVSMSNPLYVFHAYWGKFSDDAQKNKMKILAKNALSILGDNPLAFGGELSEEDLAKYHYKVMMPYFTDPVELGEYNSYDEGKSIIEKNLTSKKSNTSLVYKIEIGSNITVYGIALEGEDGESKFLPKIGEKHIAAMPYEIILQDKQASMLHGKYRLALYWPELTMGQFMKIMSTPGDIEDAMISLCN